MEKKYWEMKLGHNFEQWINFCFNKKQITYNSNIMNTMLSPYSIFFFHYLYEYVKIYTNLALMFVP